MRAINWRYYRVLLPFLHPGTLHFLLDIVEERAATGVSSRAMAAHVLGLRLRQPNNVAYAMPYDHADWKRCVDTYLAAPKHLRKKMDPIMADFYQRLMAHSAKYDATPTLLNGQPATSWRLEGVKWPL